MKDYQDHPLFQEIRPHITKRFVKYHSLNPHVFELVKKFSYEAKNSGRERFGIAMVWERMRWYVNIETKGSKFKLSNDYRSCYARLLMIEDPFFKKLFSRKNSIKEK